MLAPLVLLVVGILVALGTVRVVAGDRVTRRRVEWFALRQRLTITPGNGERVLTYLAVTRRWRRGGLVIAVVGVAYAEWWQDRVPNFEVLAAVAGWFVGMVVAEWRLDGLARVDGPRTASLRRRQLRDYVDRRLLLGPAVTWTGLVLALVVGLVRWERGTLSQRAGFLVLAGLAVVVGLLVVVVSRRVVMRGQAALAPDALAADDALRARSLRVLTGAATAIGGYLGAAAYVSAVHRPDVGTTGGQWLAQVLGFGLAPIVGIAIAVAPRRRAVPVEAPA